jgi:guanylate kinase
LHGRGDADNKVEQRLKKAEEEEPVGKALADFVLINDDLAQTVDEMLDLIAKERVNRG